jgi:uncharacterized protein (UPF0335 family)
VTNNQLKSIVERIEKLEVEKAEIAELVKDVYAEAKSNGFDVKILRKIIAQRKKSDDERRMEQELIDTYMNALGMLADLPLGQAALKNVKLKRIHDDEFN